MKKKVLALLLAAVLTVPMSTGVFAETEAEEVVVAEDDIEGIEAALEQFDGGSVSMNLESGDITFYEDEETEIEGESTEGSIPEDVEVYNSGEDEESDKLIVGSDDRIVVDAGTAVTYPFTTVVEILTEFSDGTIYSTTGIMINRYSVLTNASNLVDPTKGYWPINVTVIPAPVGNYHPYGEVSGGEVIIKEEFFDSTYGSTDPNWYLNSNYEYDMALLNLDTPLGDQTGYMKFGCNAAMQSGDEVMMVGYDANAQTLIASQGLILDVENTYFTSNLDIGDGQAGAPMIMYDSEGEESVIGIIFGENDSVNYAVRFNISTFTWILSNEKY